MSSASSGILMIGLFWVHPFREIVQARDFLLWLCQQLGIQINIPKSSLTLTQSLDYLGMRIQTVPLRVFPTHKLIQKLSSLVQAFLSDCLRPLSVWRQLLGVMSSVSCCRSWCLPSHAFTSDSSERCGVSSPGRGSGLGTILACRIFGGGPTSPIFRQVFP